jgi:hypothetical protein
MPVPAPPPITPELAIVQLFDPPPGPNSAMPLAGVIVPVTWMGFWLGLVSVMPEAYLPEKTVVIGALVNAAETRPSQ